MENFIFSTSYYFILSVNWFKIILGHGATGCSSDRQCPRNAVCDARGGACVGK